MIERTEIIIFFKRSFIDVLAYSRGLTKTLFFGTFVLKNILHKLSIIISKAKGLNGFYICSEFKNGKHGKILIFNL